MIGRQNYAILNQSNLKSYKNKKFLSEDFVYKSNTNNNFLSVTQLKKIISGFNFE